jgi:glycosyltransferase involved in cell wall biosynthesis
LEASDLNLSVIIPNYNNEKYLNECVESIIAQSFQVLEIIIVDDLSTDNSKIIINALMEKYRKIKPIFLMKNCGVSHARNVGLEKAKGEFVTFIDADDFYYNKEKLNNEMQLILEYRLKNIDIIAYSKVINVNKEGITNYTKKHQNYKYSQGFIFDKLLLGINFQNVPRDYCIKKELILKAGSYRENDNFYEDLDLLLRLSVNNEFYCTFENGTAYRQTGQGLSNMSDIKHKEKRNQIFRTYISKIKWYKKYPYIIFWFIKPRILSIKTSLIKICGY